MPSHKAYTGITLDLDVIKYLDDLAATQQRSRSFVINAIVREYAQGNPLTAAKSRERLSLSKHQP